VRFLPLIPEIEQYQYTVTVTHKRCKACKGEGNIWGYDDYGCWKPWQCSNCHGTGQTSTEERGPWRRIGPKPKKRKGMTVKEAVKIAKTWKKS
jgi:hypothetical protein